MPGRVVMLPHNDGIVHGRSSGYLNQCWGNGFHNRQHGWKPPIAIGRRAVAADRFSRVAAGATNAELAERMAEKQVLHSGE